MPYGADNIIIEDIRDKILRQALGVYYLFARLFKVFHKIRHSLAHAPVIIDRLKIRPSKLVIKIRGLISRLHFVRRRAVIPMREKCPWKRAFGYMKNAVKMQAARFRGAFPYTDVFPSSALGKRG